MSIMNYDPNLVSCGRLAAQSVRLVFGSWQYRKEMTVTVGGNCKGLAVIDTAVELALEQLYGENEFATIILEHPEQGTLECSDDEGFHGEWLKDMLISAEILSITPETP